MTVMIINVGFMVHRVMVVRRIVRVIKVVEVDIMFGLASIGGMCLVEVHITLDCYLMQKISVNFKSDVLLCGLGNGFGRVLDGSKLGNACNSMLEASALVGLSKFVI